MIGGLSPGRFWEFFSSPPRPDRLWGPPSLLFNGYQGLFQWRQSGRSVKLTTHLHLVPGSRMRGNIPPLLQRTCMAWCSVKSEGQLYLFTFLPSLGNRSLSSLYLKRATTLLWFAVIDLFWYFTFFQYFLTFIYYYLYNFLKYRFNPSQHVSWKHSSTLINLFTYFNTALPSVAHQPVPFVLV
jgi:hypothetical protein